MIVLSWLSTNYRRKWIQSIWEAIKPSVLFDSVRHLLTFRSQKSNPHAEVIVIDQSTMPSGFRSASNSKMSQSLLSTQRSSTARFRTSAYFRGEPKCDEDVIPEDPEEVFMPELFSPIGGADGDYLQLRNCTRISRPADKIAFANC